MYTFHMTTSSNQIDYSLFLFHFIFLFFFFFLRRCIFFAAMLINLLRTSAVIVEVLPLFNALHLKKKNN